MLFEECRYNTWRANLVVVRRAVDSSERLIERGTAWDTVQLRVSEAVPLNDLSAGCSVRVIPDANDEVWGTTFRRAG